MSDYYILQIMKSNAHKTAPKKETIRINYIIYFLVETIKFIDLHYISGKIQAKNSRLLLNTY
jgi:hypothetical protein